MTERLFELALKKCGNTNNAHVVQCPQEQGGSERPGTGDVTYISCGPVRGADFVGGDNGWFDASVTQQRG